MSTETDDKQPKIDLTPYTSHPDKFRTAVYARNEFGIGGQWRFLLGGLSTLVRHREFWFLEMSMPDVHDDVGDSSKAVRIQLVGLEFTMVAGYHSANFNAWLHPEPSEFRVPDPGQHPYPERTLCTCKECPHRSKGEHYMAGYVPKPNPQLFKIIRECQLSILIGGQPPPGE